MPQMKTGDIGSIGYWCQRTQHSFHHIESRLRQAGVQPVFVLAGIPRFDWAGADVAGDIPLLAAYGEGLDDLVGQGRAEIRDGKILLAGYLVDATTAGQRVLGLARGGVNLQASVGYVPLRKDYVPAGQTVRVNGQTIQAPDEGLTVVRAGKLREISLLPLGADPDTHVSIAAKGRTMTTDANTPPTNPTR